MKRSYRGDELTGSWGGRGGGGRFTSGRMMVVRFLSFKGETAGKGTILRLTTVKGGGGGRERVVCQGGVGVCSVDP